MLKIRFIQVYPVKLSSKLYHTLTPTSADLQLYINIVKVRTIAKLLLVLYVVEGLVSCYIHTEEAIVFPLLLLNKIKKIHTYYKSYYKLVCNQFVMLYIYKFKQHTSFQILSVCCIIALEIMHHYLLIQARSNTYSKMKTLCSMVSSS